MHETTANDTSYAKLPAPPAGDTIRYRGREYGEAEALALLQALAEPGRESNVVCKKDTNKSVVVTYATAYVGSYNVATRATPWAALCAAVKAAGLEEAKGPADAAK